MRILTHPGQVVAVSLFGFVAAGCASSSPPERSTATSQVVDTSTAARTSPVVASPAVAAPPAAAPPATVASLPALAAPEGEQQPPSAVETSSDTSGPDVEASQPRLPDPQPAADDTPAGQDVAKGRRRVGRCSFYGKAMHGRKTASGERYDRKELTAAHRRLPFGTRVEVTNLSNGKSVVVRVNDRGPFGNKRRIMDLSRAAARKLGMVDRGVTRCELQPLAAGS